MRKETDLDGVKAIAKALLNTKAWSLSADQPKPHGDNKLMRIRCVTVNPS